MAGVRPVARTFMVCDEIVPDPDRPTLVSLIRLASRVRGAGSPPYPFVHPTVSAYAELVECRTAGDVWVEVVHADTDAVTFRTRRRRLTFNGDPLHMYGLRFRMQNLLFMAPGLHWVQLWFEGDLLGQRPLVLE